MPENNPSEILASLGLDQIRLPKDLQLALSADPETFSNADLGTMEKYLQILDGYILYLQVETNKRSATFIDLKKGLEEKLGFAVCKLQGSSLKEREFKALEQSSELQKMSLTVRQAEVATKVMDNFVDAITEKLNVRKKIYDARIQERRYPSR